MYKYKNSGFTMKTGIHGGSQPPYKNSCLNMKHFKPIAGMSYFRLEDDSESSACACNNKYKPVLNPKPTPFSTKKRSLEKPASMKLTEVSYTRANTHSRREEHRRRDSNVEYGIRCSCLVIWAQGVDEVMPSGQLTEMHLVACSSI